MKGRPMSCNSCCKKLKLICAALLVLCSASVLANDWHAELPQAKPLGQGELRWFGFSIYSATLWSEHVPFDQTAPFALELTYHVHVTRERFVQTSLDEIKRLFDQRFSADKLKNWEALMSQAFPEVHDGDQLIGIFIPHQGCRFYDRSGLRIDIRDPEFAEAFFAIWLDPRSKDSKLRQHLLGITR